LQARQDSLTGLLNRRFLLDLAEREFQRAQRYRTTLAVAMLDLDGFKAVNDRFGHAAGDKVLQEVARCLAESVRAVDMVGRYGGDEFLLVLPDTSENTAQRIAARLQEQIETLALDVGGEPVSLGLSAGVAVAHSAAADSLDSLIALADAEMYRVKAARRAEGQG
jgi:diguanylate cyclase (GGDEF)-like protein